MGKRRRPTERQPRRLAAGLRVRSKRGVKKSEPNSLTDRANPSSPFLLDISNSRIGNFKVHFIMALAKRTLPQPTSDSHDHLQENCPTEDRRQNLASNALRAGQLIEKTQGIAASLLGLIHCDVGLFQQSFAASPIDSEQGRSDTCRAPVFM